MNRVNSNIDESSDFMPVQAKTVIGGRSRNSRDALLDLEKSKNDFHLTQPSVPKTKNNYCIPIPLITTTSLRLVNFTSILLIFWLRTREMLLRRCVVYNLYRNFASINDITQNFLPTLKDHLLGRMVDEPSGGFTDQDRRNLLIHNNQIFCHKTLRINFTTYDCRRDQDTINPLRQSDVMVLANADDEEDSHPYWYARVIGIFHAMVCRVGSREKFTQVDFLWVRWYGLDTQIRSGFKSLRLHQVGFLAGDEAFGFIDPDDVIRAVHLIPRFRLGTASERLPLSMARREDEGGEDYMRYYISM